MLRQCRHVRDDPLDVGSALRLNDEPGAFHVKRGSSTATAPTLGERNL